MKSKKEFTFGTAVSIASGQFGGMMGAGFGSGAVFVVYCLHAGGLLGPLQMLVSTLCMFAVFYLCLSVCRKYQLRTYNEMMTKIWGKAGKTIAPFSLMSMIFCFFVYSIDAFAGAASLVEQYQTPLIVGILICEALSLLVASKGIEFFNKIAALLAIPMFLIITITYLVSFFGFGGLETYRELVASGWHPEGVSSLYGWRMTLFIAFGNIPFISIYLLNMDKMTKNRHVVTTLGVGFIFCLFTFVLPAFCLLGFMPEVGETAMPLLYLLRDVMNFPPAAVIYLILISFALVSTGAGCMSVFAEMGHSWCNKLNLKWPENIKKLILPVLICLLAIPFSFMGLLNFLHEISTILGWVNCFMVFLPVLIRGIILLCQKDSKTEVEMNS